MNQFKFGKNMLIISIMTLLTVFIWIGFDVYRTYTKTTVPTVMRELTQPLNPTLNKNVIEEIEKKYQPSAEELNAAIPLTPELEAEEEASPSQIATPSGSLE